MGQVEQSEVVAPSAPAPAVDAPTAPSFCWEYRNGIDAKGRVVMPASYRQAFASAGGFLTVWQGRCLAAMPAEEFRGYVDHLTRQLAHSHEEAPGEVLRELWRSSVELKLDLQGRLSLPEALRAAAGIANEVRFVGNGRRVELWPADATADEDDERDDHRATIAMLQAGYDVPLHGS